MSNSRVLVLGGYGVFGARLSAALLRDGRFEVVVAGRSQQRAEAFCATCGGSPVALDRDDLQLAQKVAALAPQIVIDATGPFQGYGRQGYALPHAAIACGAHYIDLSDDAAFSAGIAALNVQAKTRGVVVISGASSVPGLSSAAVAGLAAGLVEIDRIESVILPGNRAPRGRSVIRAILVQVGQPMQVWQSGRWQGAHGWGRLRRERLAVPDARALSPRWSSLIGAPDLALFPRHYRARTVLFRAGLELSVLHLGLAGLGLLVRARLLPSLEPVAPLLRWVAQRLERFGSDRGGMAVTVSGTTATGTLVERRWLLLAEAGDGPEVPALSARILCGHIADGRLAPGARPCLRAFVLAEVEAAARGLSLSFRQTEMTLLPLFERALGPTFASLPAPVRALHHFADSDHWQGHATVERGFTPVATVICNLMGFPQTGEAVPVAVEMSRTGDRELWQRIFAGKRFRSVMRLAGPPGSGQITESFGPLRFQINLAADAGGLRFPVTRGWLFGIRLPRWLLPKSQTRESAAGDAATFDVAVSLPFVGRIVRYRGQLHRTPLVLPD